MQHPDRYVAQLEHFAIVGVMHIVTGIGIGAVDDLRTRFLGQIEVTRHKIGVKVRLEHVSDGGPGLLRLANIRRRFPKGVDDGRFARAFDIVGSLRQATRV